jgi:phage portal protein BeeE
VLADRISSALVRSESRTSVDTWLQDFLMPATWNQWGGSSPYGLQMTSPHMRVTEIMATLDSYAAALRRCPPAFAAQMVRALVLSQAKFIFRGRASANKARKTFGTRDLAPLERPWTNATTGQMLAQMEWHAGLAGNAYVTNRTKGRLRVLRPDWVAVVYGSQQEPEDAAMALDGEVIGYAYANGGLSAPGNGSLTSLASNRVEMLLPDEVSHWSPVPDPQGGGIGMSWITPAIRDIQTDQAATEHKIAFFKRGAPQPLDAKVLTPTGWSPMGEIRVGGEVVGADGQPHRVTAIYPQGEQDIYRVWFRDGTSTECTIDHIWTVTNNYDRQRNVTRQMSLGELMSHGFHYDSGPAKWAVPMAEPVEYERSGPLPLDPYLLGLLLGDGSFRGNGKGSGGVTLAAAVFDADETAEIITPMVPNGVSLTRRDRTNRRGEATEFYFRSHRPAPRRNWRGQISGHASNPLTDIIKALGLFDVHGRDKFIPEQYLRASVKDRVALLQGLIDSDGHIDAGCRYTTTSPVLADGLRELVGSLGGNATVRRNKGRTTLTVTICQLPDWIVPARLMRKADAYRPTSALRVRTMVRAELVRRAPAQCIAVDSDDHLYVTDDFIVTHNTPNLVVKGIPAATQTQFDELVSMMESRHAGVANAYRTLYLTAGADATVVGSNFRDMDLKNLTGAGETRISALSRVPASVLGISEGLAGSSLNAGNFGMARRIFADTWVYPTLQDLAAALAPMVHVPSDADLWFDTSDMPILREDARDAADIEMVKQTTIVGYVREGFTPESAVAAVNAQDITLLKHSGLTSVQLQPPNPNGPPVDQAAPGQLPPVPAGF